MASPCQKARGFYLYLSNLLETSAMRDVSLTIQKKDGEIQPLSLKRLPYLGHPMVEPDIILKDIEVIQQSSKTDFTLDVHLKWKNEDLIYNLFA